MKKKLLVPTVILALGLPAFAWAQPGAIICGLVGVSGLEPGPGNTYVQRSVPADAKAGFPEMLSASRARVEDVLWTPSSRPDIIVLDGSPLFGLLPYNAHGSAVALPYKSCLMIGPEGMSVDVLAHELVHAEVAALRGYRRYLLDTPRWFDEGIAMQVDEREPYGPHAILEGGRERVREALGGEFRRGSREEVVSRYASAKAVVADMLAARGADALRETLRVGTFDGVVP